MGPSSSHTVGPLRAARVFAEHLVATGRLAEVTRIRCSLFGSLGSTGLGHGTPDAVLAGLRGLRPETCDPSDVRAAWSGLDTGATITLLGGHTIPILQSDVHFEPHTRLPGHPNALTLSAFGADPFGTDDSTALFEETYYFIGGGFYSARRRPDSRGRSSAAAPLRVQCRIARAVRRARAQHLRGRAPQRRSHPWQRRIRCRTRRHLGRHARLCRSRPGRRGHAAGRTQGQASGRSGTYALRGI